MAAYQFAALFSAVDYAYRYYAVTDAGVTNVDLDLFVADPNKNDWSATIAAHEPSEGQNGT